MQKFFGRLWPSTLFPRLMVLIVLALLLALGVSVWLLSSAHREALRDRSQQFKLRQFISQVQLLEEIPESLHPKAIKAWRRPGRDLELFASAPIRRSTDPVALRLQHYMEESLGDSFRGRVRVQYVTDKHRHDDDWRERRSEQHPRTWPGKPQHPDRRHHRLHDLSVAVQLSNGRWLGSQMDIPQIGPIMARQTLVFVAVSSLLVFMVVFWQLRKIVRPLKSLELAANDLGRGVEVQPLPEEGPDDIKTTLRAFNHMNERLQRFVSDRTRMLASLSHDLRTPITSMRLRLEMMEPGEHRDKLLASLDEMQQMSEATLAFVRESGDVERTSAVDFGALLDSLCEDLQELGLPVSIQTPPDSVILEGRPVALRRALRNIIENAVAYGDVANIQLHSEAKEIRVSVTDSGPGIPESAWDDVFEPFNRLETSRNRETGGVGLGLSIAQQIVNSHGGSIRFANLESGFCVTVILPLV
ncbi:MAG: ATP-binding protein [Pseudomonadota bacterium]